MAPELSFDGRVAVISGAGSGLGADLALELARRGCRVLVNNRLRGEVDKAAAVARRITDEGGTARVDHSDLSTEAGGEAAVQRALDDWGRVDVAVHAAGVLRDRSAARLSSAELDEVLDVHLRGAFHLALPAYRAMRAGGGGCLLFLSSAAGIFGNPGQANYAAAKMGLLGLSNVLAIEGAAHGVRSNVVSPYALTPATEAFLPAFGMELPPSSVTALLVALAAPGCTRTQRVYSAGGGHFARMVVGLTSGWTAAPGQAPRAEDVAAHLDAVDARDELTFPESAVEEIRALAARLRS